MKICDSPRSLKVKVLVAQSCLILCNLMGCSQLGSSVHARIVEWVAIPFSRGSSRPRDRTRLQHCRQILPLQASLVVQTVKNLPTMHLSAVQETPVPSLIPWRREWLPTPVFLPGQLQGQRSLARLQTTESQSRTRLSG